MVESLAVLKEQSIKIHELWRSGKIGGCPEFDGKGFGELLFGVANKAFWDIDKLLIHIEILEEDNKGLEKAFQQQHDVAADYMERLHEAKTHAEQAENIIDQVHKELESTRLSFQEQTARANHALEQIATLREALEEIKNDLDVPESKFDTEWAGIEIRYIDGILQDTDGSQSRNQSEEGKK